MNRLSRRSFLRTASVGCAGLAVPWWTTARAEESAFAPFDREMEAFMTARKVPGGALAVVKDRRLVYARGYGWADRENKVPATSDSLFRIASVTKPITGVAIVKLFEQGRLQLDARAFDLLQFEAPRNKKPDPRLAQITVRQLLHHTGGWDRDKSFDPMFRPILIAKELGTTPPASAASVIRYMLGQPLDFDPGTRFVYSNFGYCVLGRVIEKLTGQSYEAYVQKHILAPLGVARMRIGASRREQRAPGEVIYYTNGSDKAKNVFPGRPKEVAWPYGGFHLEAMDAHGGWLASAVDLARFAAGLRDPARCPILQPDSFRTLFEPPAPPVSRNEHGELEDFYCGCGWFVRPRGTAGSPNYWHAGSLPGTSSLLVLRGDGLSWVALFNQRSEDQAQPDSSIDPALHRAAHQVREWPAHDLFTTAGTR